MQIFMDVILHKFFIKHLYYLTSLTGLLCLQIIFLIVLQNFLYYDTIKMYFYLKGMV